MFHRTEINIRRVLGDDMPFVPELTLLAVRKKREVLADREPIPPFIRIINCQASSVDHHTRRTAIATLIGSKNQMRVSKPFSFGFDGLKLEPFAGILPSLRQRNKVPIHSSTFFLDEQTTKANLIQFSPSDKNARHFLSKVRPLSPICGTPLPVHPRASPALVRWSRYPGIHSAIPLQYTSSPAALCRCQVCRNIPCRPLCTAL